MTRDYLGVSPKIDADVFVAETAALIGDVEVGAGSSVWYGAVLRADTATIKVGRASSIQDNAVVHCDTGFPALIGDNVTVGHGAIVHGAAVGSNTLIGMGATVLSGAVIGENCIVGAGALVRENTAVPDGSLVVGVPGKVVRQLSPEQIDAIAASARHYVELSKNYMSGENRENDKI
ncbi:MAG: gamma carbonic anhydrase family protein [Butyricicoccus sp.]|nr:gamma carbonic anhydrase family protein [Butyricicoccus sp.]